jgi:hypothetical protein
MQNLGGCDHSSVSNEYHRQRQYKLLDCRLKGTLKFWRTPCIEYLILYGQYIQQDVHNTYFELQFLEFFRIF